MGLAFALSAGMCAAFGSAFGKLALEGTTIQTLVDHGARLGLAVVPPTSLDLVRPLELLRHLSSINLSFLGCLLPAHRLFWPHIPLKRLDVEFLRQEHELCRFRVCCRHQLGL